MLEQVIWIVITCVATPLSILPVHWLGYRLQDYLESKRPGWFD